MIVVLYTTTACFLASNVLAMTYAVRDLGQLINLPGRTDSQPNAINSSGQIAGVNVAGGIYTAQLYDGAWTNLGTLGEAETLCSGMNDSSQVVGYSLTDTGVKHAFLWTPGGTDGVAGNPQMKDLGTLGGIESQAYCINGAGQIAGYSQTTGRDHAFLYSGGKMTDIGALLSGSRHSYGYSINDAGHIAGTAYNNSYSASDPFFYNGSVAVIIGGSGVSNGSALGINNGDHIVGYGTVGGFDRAFRHYSGVMTVLDTLGGNYSYAIGINNSNVIVGGSFIDEADTVYHAFVCISNSVIDLNTLLDATGAGWTLIEARAINDAGQIVGVGQFDGTDRAFLLNPVMTMPTAPTITDLKISGTNILVSFTSSAAATYAVEVQTDIATGNWSEVINGLPGTGAIMTVTNLGGLSGPTRFFRVRVATP